MLEVKIFSFSELFLHQSFVKVNFCSYKEGVIGIHNNHEPMKFKVTPGKIILTNNDGEQILYTGYGFASCKDNIIYVIGFPIADTLESFRLNCSKLDEYGKNCRDNFGIFCDF